VSQSNKLYYLTVSVFADLFPDVLIVSTERSIDTESRLSQLIANGYVILNIICNISTTTEKHSATLATQTLQTSY